MSLPDYDQIEGEAFERYVVDLIRTTYFAGPDDRSAQLAVLKDVRLAGSEYPHHEVEVDSESASNPERKFTTLHSIANASDRETARAVVRDLLLDVLY
jgi:hypothetical protein